MKQKLMGAYAAALVTTATRFTNPCGVSTGLSTSEGGSYGIIPTNGKIRNFRVRMSTYAADGTTAAFYTFTIRINQADTAISITLTDNAGNPDNIQGSYIGELSVNAGDRIDIACVPSSSPAPTQTPLFSTILEFESNTANEAILLSGSVGGLPSVAGTVYCTTMGIISSNAVEVGREIIMPCSGIITAFFVRLSGTVGVGNSHTLTVRVGQDPVDTDATLVFNDAVKINDSIIGRNITVNAGDRVSIGVVTTGTPSSRTAGFGILFKPTVDGTFPLTMCGSSSLMGGGTTNFAGLATARTNSITETSQQNIGWDDFQLKTIWAWLSVNPGSGKSVTITMRKDGGDLAETPTITLTNSQGPSSADFSTPYTPTQWSLYGHKLVLTTAATGTSPTVSVAAFMQAANPNDMHSFGDSVEWD